MKTLFASAISLLFSLCVYGQFAPNAGEFYPATGTEGYQMLEENFNQQLIHRLFSNMKTGKPALELVRYDADNFICIKYDSAGMQTGKGIISPNKERAPHYTVRKPDLVNDPDMTKGLLIDTVLYDVYFDKNGYWEEEAMDGTQWQGNYDHDIKTGLWKRVKSAASKKDKFLDSVVIFENGSPLMDPYSAYSSKQLFALIAGKWYADLASLGKTYQLFHRKSSSVFVKQMIDFVSADNVVFTNEGKPSTATWAFKNNQLLIALPSQTSKASIAFLNNESLIIQNLSN